jgi:RNase adaptor protein for sRNA GlmZ degradation
MKKFSDYKKINESTEVESPLIKIVEKYINKAIRETDFDKNILKNALNKIFKYENKVSSIYTFDSFANTHRMPKDDYLTIKNLICEYFEELESLRPTLYSTDYLYNTEYLYKALPAY